MINSQYLLTFLLNSLWQAPLVLIAAMAATWLLRQAPAIHRHTIWVAALAAAVLLPIASIDRQERTKSPLPKVELGPVTASPGQGAPESSGATAAPATANPRRTFWFTEPAFVLVGRAYVVWLLIGVTRLLMAFLRTVRIRLRARQAPLPAVMERVRRSCEEAFGLENIGVLFSHGVAGPAATGHSIILPEAMLDEPSEAVLTTAIGHEMAHIARQDFTCKILYELLRLPVGFQPAVWWMSRGIEQSREMACDEAVTARLMPRAEYASSMLQIAAAMTAKQQPGYVLGVFDGDVLEERIRRLMSAPARSKRLRLATGLSMLAVCGVLAYGLAFTARAQSQNAVQADAESVAARLATARALMARPAQSRDVGRIRQEYLAVLQEQPRNVEALVGMAGVSAFAHEFADAHSWSLRAVTASPGDPDGYYTAGFVDWSEVYPEYSKLRAAAGMSTQDQSIVPDAGARTSFRARYAGTLDDGLRMLQTALQLDPGNSDAMAYLNLLCRIEAGLADTAEENQRLLAQADGWLEKAMANAKASWSTTLPAPPPPPPPPPGKGGGNGGK